MKLFSSFNNVLNKFNIKSEVEFFNNERNLNKFKRKLDR